MTKSGAVLPLLVFEAADCLMALPACEIAHLEQRGGVPKGARPLFVDLGEYFANAESDGPWLHWTRGARSAQLRVGRVIDVVPFPLSGLTAMPALLSAQESARAFLAAGVCGGDVFLLLDPERLNR